MMNMYNYKQIRDKLKISNKTCHQDKNLDL